MGQPDREHPPGQYGGSGRANFPSDPICSFIEDTEIPRPGGVMLDDASAPGGKSRIIVQAARTFDAAGAVKPGVLWELLGFSLDIVF
jgi:hypothetical protein